MSGGDEGTDTTRRPASADPDPRLATLRERIQTVDRELIELVKRRRDLALEIGRLKAELGLPVMDPSQEAHVVRRAAETARKLDVDEELMRDVIWRIIASARDAQEGRTRWGPPPAPGPAEDPRG
jgi:chorismate mutase